MALILTQTDDASPCPVEAGCSGRLIANATNSDCEISEGGTPGVLELLAGPKGGDVNTVFFLMSSGALNKTTWAAGNWTVRFNITTANANVTITEIYICRYNSSCASQATVGSATGLSIDGGTTGVKTQVISGTEQTADATDRVSILLVGSAGNHGTQNIGITPDQNIDIPSATGNTFDESITLGKSLGLTADVAAVFDPLLTLVKALNLTTAANTTFEPSITLDKFLGITASAQKVMEESITLALSKGISFSSGLSFEAAITLGKSLALTADADAVFEGNITLSQTKGITVETILQVEAAITLAKQQGIAVTAQKIMEESITLSKSLGISTAGGQVIDEAITLSKQLGVSAEAQLIVEAAVTLSTLREIFAAGEGGSPLDQDRLGLFWLWKERS